jgi:hypothetical protein
MHSTVRLTGLRSVGFYVLPLQGVFKSIMLLFKPEQNKLHITYSATVENKEFPLALVISLYILLFFIYYV